MYKICFLNVYKMNIILVVMLVNKYIVYVCVYICRYLLCLTDKKLIVDINSG